MASSELMKVMRLAYSDAAFRGKVLYFPDKICAEYGLIGDESDALLTGDATRLELSPEERQIIEAVLDTHDMSAGE